MHRAMRLALLSSVAMLTVDLVGAVAGGGAGSPIVVFEPRRKALLSAQLSSVVVTVHKERGQVFAKGDPLIALDDTVFKANHAKAGAELELARERLKARNRLFADDTLPRVELQEALAATLVAQAGLAIAEKELSDCQIKAPFRGRVGRVLVNEHETVRPGQGLIEVIDDHTLLAVFLLPSRSLTRLKLEHPVSIRVLETGGVVRGRLRQMDAQVDPVSSTIRAYAEIDNRAKILRGGMRGILLTRELFVDSAASREPTRLPTALSPTKGPPRGRRGEK